MSVRTEQRSTTAEKAGPSADGRRPRDWRWPCFIAALALFLALTYLAVVQDPRPNAYAKPPIGRWDWWRYPLEGNAPCSLARIEGDLYAVFAQPDGKHVCVVGDGGLIVTTGDGGRTWTRRTVVLPKDWSPPPSLEALDEDDSSNEPPDVNEIESTKKEILKSGASKNNSRHLPVDNTRMLLVAETSPPPNDQPGKATDRSNMAKQNTIPNNQKNVAQGDPCAEVKCPAGESCADGQCVKFCKSAAECDDKNKCTTDTCEESICLYTNKDCGGGTECDHATGECKIGFFTALRDVKFVDERYGWAVGFGRTILATSDGGHTWAPQRSGSYGPFDLLSSVFFVNPTAGWSVGSAETILVTSDGGQTWVPQQSGVTNSLSSVYFVNPKMGWAVGSRGTILATSDGGQTWVPQGSDEYRMLTSVFFVNLQTGWAVGVGGTILATSDGGQTWVPQGSDEYRNLICVFFVNPMTGWVVGYSGILATADGGQTWVPQQSGVTNSLSSVYFVNPKTGWAVGSGGKILATVDGGQNWFHQTQRRAEEQKADPKLAIPSGNYDRWPAPWYYASLILVAGLVSQTLRKPAPVTIGETVANKLVSDRPLNEGDPDPLNIGALARGISRFLRNPNTTPPLTIAATGKWGSGKSSLMNLLKADLERWDFRPVWFNAWHHQKEENLLAALLENIRAQAVPTLTSLKAVLPWIGFRWRLLRRRGKRFWPIALPLMFIFGASAGYVLYDYSRNEGKHISALGQDLGALFRTSGEKEKLADADEEQKSDNSATTTDQAKAETEEPSGIALLAIIGTSFPPIFTLLKGLRAFGVNPGALMASCAGSLKVRDLGAQAAFRHQFEREFADVTDALGDRQMVIFVDDLDRIRPAKLLEIFESINYLVTSGACFVVLGMDRDQITRSIGTELKEVSGFGEAFEENIPDKEGKQISDPRKKQIEFAMRYMEKLVNIEVPVPVHSPSEASRIVVIPRKEETKRPILLRWWPTLRAAAIALIFLFAGTWGVRFGVNRCEKDSQIVVEDRADVDKTKQPVSIDTERGERKGRGEESTRPGTMKAGQSPTLLRWLAFGLLIVIVPIGIWGLKLQTDPKVLDSGDFTAALDVWLPILATDNHKNTPRALKRFLNRVRYYAMLLRPGETAKDQRPPIPEDILVAMAASREMDALTVNGRVSPTLDREKLNTHVRAVLYAFEDESRDKEAQKLQTDFASHVDRMANEELLDRFSRLTMGVRIT